MSCWKVACLELRVHPRLSSSITALRTARRIICARSIRRLRWSKAPNRCRLPAVNRGIRRARFSQVCVLNNDMLVEPGFLQALQGAFDQVPDLFSSTAQIFFPEGRRREETGKTVMPAQRELTDFPVRCDEPIDGEDLSYVLYGSGGCSLYDADKRLWR